MLAFSNGKTRALKRSRKVQNHTPSVPATLPPPTHTLHLRARAEKHKDIKNSHQKCHHRTQQRFRAWGAHEVLTKKHGLYTALGCRRPLPLSSLGVVEGLTGITDSSLGCRNGDNSPPDYCYYYYYYLLLFLIIIVIIIITYPYKGLVV